jgi:hypothetical protein
MSALLGVRVAPDSIAHWWSPASALIDAQRGDVVGCLLDGRVMRCRYVRDVGVQSVAVRLHISESQGLYVAGEFIDADPTQVVRWEDSA